MVIFLSNVTSWISLSLIEHWDDVFTYVVASVDGDGDSDDDIDGVNISAILFERLAILVWYS